MTTEIKGKSIRQCSNCRKSLVLQNAKCEIREKEKEVVIQSLLADGKSVWIRDIMADSQVGKIIREDGFCPFESRYIETPLSILNGIYLQDLEYSKRGLHSQEDVGKFAKCMVCSDKKTYLGIYLGEFPQSISISYKREDQTMDVGPGFYNPAIWVMQLNRIVWGSESYWGIIEKPEDLKAITSEDVNSIWYVKALHSMIKDVKE